MERDNWGFPINGNDENDDNGITEINDIDDSELIKLKLMNDFKDLLFANYDCLDKQNSRLTKKEIFRLVIMESTDTIIDVPLYNPITTNYRIHQISLNGLGRKEILELGKTIMSPDYSQMGDMPQENIGFRQKIGKFFRREL